MRLLLPRPSGMGWVEAGRREKDFRRRSNGVAFEDARSFDCVAHDSHELDLACMTTIAPHIEVDENVRFGKPVIAGTRVPVDLIPAKLAAGLTVEQIVAEYGLTIEQFRAALAYAAKTLAEEEIRVVR
jgi:uncharacterized protein (DUF433 family)